MGILYCCCCCCLNNLFTKTLEIISIIFHSTQLLFVLICLIGIKWSLIPTINLVLFILMLILILILLSFIILLRYWRAKGTIKTTRKSLGINFSTIAFASIIFCLIISFVELFVMGYGFYTTNYPCINSKDNNNQNNYYNYNYNYRGGGYYSYYKTKNNNNENKRNLNTDKDKDSDIESLCANKDKYYYAGIISGAQYMLAYTTFAILEFTLILGIWIWFILRRRIVHGLDRPSPISRGQGQGGVYDPYGRQVVVVQPGDVVVMDGQRHVAMPIGQYNQCFEPYMQNNNNNAISNLPQSQVNVNQNSAQIPGSNENIQEKPY